MSSVVNKSSTRFVPKIASRGQRTVGLTTHRASFSSSQRPLSLASTERIDSRREQQYGTVVHEKFDNGEDLHSSSSTNLANSSIGLPDAAESVATKEDEQGLHQRTAETVLADAVIGSKTQTPPIAMQRLSSLSQTPSFVPRNPTNNLDSVGNESSLSNRISKVKPRDGPLATGNEKKDSQEILGRLRPIKAMKPTRYDDTGREIIEPEDLLKLGRGRTASESSLEDKAINVETFTMATLCHDIPIGQTNEDYLRFENARISRKRRRARVHKAKLMMKGLYEPRKPELRDELKQLYQEYKEEREERFGRSKDPAQAQLRAMDADAEAQQVVRLHRGKDGAIVLDSESQRFDRHINNKADSVNTNAQEIDKFSTVINSYSFSAKERPERWTDDETNMFFSALSVWGTDFNLIAHMFPSRTRHQIKTKFKYEERKNSAKVQMYLVHRRKVNIKEYAKISGTDIVDVDRMEDELARIRSEHHRQLKLEEEMKQQAFEEDANRQRLADNALIAKREQVKHEKR